MNKNNPGKFNCYEKAKPDEPMFILLGRDIAAPSTIYHWIGRRLVEGKNTLHDQQIIEAINCACEMHEWRRNQEITKRVIDIESNK